MVAAAARFATADAIEQALEDGEADDFEAVQLGLEDIVKALQVGLLL